MSNIDKALRSTSERDWFEDWFKREFHPDKTGPYIKDQLFFAVRAARAPLLDELEAAEKRIAELSALQGKPIAWESTTPVYVKFITDERYQRLRPGYKKWYKPYRCSQCAAAGKGEAS